MIHDEQQNTTWDQYISQALKAQRSRQNRATGETPAMALLGYEITLPGQWEIPEYRTQRVDQRKERANMRQKIVARQLDFNNEVFPNKHRDPTVMFELHDLVLVKNYSNEPFAPAWVGPHPIIEILANNMYIVDRNGHAARYHIDQLRKTPRGNEQDSDNDESGSDDSDNNSPSYPPSVIEHVEQTETSAVADGSGPAETDVDPGPSTSGQPNSHRDAAETIYSIRRVTHTRQTVEHPYGRWPRRTESRTTPQTTPAKVPRTTMSTPSTPAPSYRTRIFYNKNFMVPRRS